MLEIAKGKTPPTHLSVKFGEDGVCFSKEKVGKMFSIAFLRHTQEQVPGCLTRGE